MNLSHKLTFSLASIFLLLAFAAVPVMAHQLDPNVAPHVNADPDTAATPGTDHALVKSIEVSSMYLTATSPITATITFADGVAAIADDDATTGTGNNEARHAILSAPATLVTSDLTLMIGTKQDDGTYTYAALEAPYTTAGAPQVTALIKTRTEGSGDTGSGAVYTAYISIPTDANTAFDGQYSVSITSTSGVFNPATIMGEFRMDTQMPTVMDVANRAIGQNYANLQGEWSDPFEITFKLEDPMDSADFNADPVVFLTDSASGLKLSTLMFDVDMANELTFGGAQFIGEGQYVVKATPVTATTVKSAATVKVTIKVMDNAGNEGMSDALTVKLAERAATGTGTGPGDTTPPTVTITSAAGTGTDADKVIFTFAFSEALATTGDNAFTVADLDVSNTPTLVAANLVSTDNRNYKLTVTRENEDFPVKASFKSGAKIGDPAGNVLVAAQLAKTDTYTPEGVLGVEIDAPTALEFGTLTFTFTFAEQPAQADTDGNLPSGAFTVSDVRASNAEPLVAANLREPIQDDDTDEFIYELDVTPLDPTQPVTVQLRAKSVSNAATGDDRLVAGQVSATWTPATDETPATDVIMIPANSYVVVVRDKDAASGIGGLAFRSDVMVREWADMPDLERLFYTGNQGIILGGGGGGALILTEDASQTTDLVSGTVGISEVMWAIDANYLGNPALNTYAGSQWIELHNLNTIAANVRLSWKTGRAITSDGTITGNLANPVLDVVTNFFHDRPGNERWEVPGANGASVTGVNFVSMARKGTFDLNSRHENKPANQFNKRYTRTGGAGNSPDGRNKDQWAAATAAYLSLRTNGNNVLYEYLGTPGRANTVSPETQPHIRAGRTGVATNDIYISEVGNSSDDRYDWIELAGPAGKNLRNYLISIVTNNTTDNILVQFDANDNAKIADNGHFLILRTDPADEPDHPIAATGYNVDLSAEAQQPGTPNSPVRYKVFSGNNPRGALNLPNDGKFVLIVRRPDNHEGHRSGANGGKGVAERGNADLDKVVDVAGWDDNVGRNSYPNAVSNTGLWPLHSFGAPFTNRNAFWENTVHRRQYRTTNDGRSGAGAHENKNQDDRAAFRDIGWTGVGYRRDVDHTLAQHGGTPGYPNGASHGAGGTITAAVYISEIMYADARSGSLAQWIELRNTSNTVGADLHNWRLTIRNHGDSEMHEDGGWSGKDEGSVLLRGLKIKPNGSVLITSRKGPRSDVHLAESEIFTLWSSHKAAFGMKTINSDVINPFGFKITLHANGHEGDRNKWQLVDEVGNLAALDATDRRGNNDRFDMPRWMWPDGKTEAGTRISVARRNAFGGSKATGFTLADGKEESGWILSNMDGRTHLIDNVYYGHMDDMSTPGQTVGQPLPVELSYFRPTLENGKVTIQWTTESELDNAGFNILRSETRDGEFTQVNEQMIQGKGTTAERSTYKWVDTTAKPGAVYYYQIEDVSFAGEHTKLATTKLKGLISAKGKRTLQWGDLKNLR